MLFGVLASEAGWRLAETMAMSVLVIGGASQFTALQLLCEHAPLVIAIVTAAGGQPAPRDVFRLAGAAHRRARRPWQRALAAYCLTDQTYGGR